MEFEKKVVIITGASSGIGEACALNLAKAGGFLSLVGRNVENLNRVARNCAQLSGKEPLTVIADISVSEDVEKIVHYTIRHYGKIDVLVNNAGILIVGGINEDISNLDKLIATNVRGTYLLTQKSIPHLIKTKGNIVIISSVLSTFTVPVLTCYSMTKAALDTLTRCIALELGPKGVRVNAINPGLVNNDFFKRSGMSDHDHKKQLKEVEEVTPLRRIADCEDVANIVTFIANDKAKSITGSFHYVDGGIHLGKIKSKDK